MTLFTKFDWKELWTRIRNYFIYQWYLLWNKDAFVIKYVGDPLILKGKHPKPIDTPSFSPDVKRVIIDGRRCYQFSHGRHNWTVFHSDAWDGAWTGPSVSDDLDTDQQHQIN